MKTTTLILTVAAGLMVLGTACKKENKVQQQGDFRALNAGPTPLSPCTDTLGPVILSGKISTNTTLNSNTLYYLDGVVAVEGATLTIQPGTIIRGLAGTPASGGNPGTPGGVLVITKTGFIDAQGTASCPIVFTSYRERSGIPAPGDWGGIVILGEAPTNRSTSSVVEGIPNNLAGGVTYDNTYGGSSTGDNSGILTHVRIEYAGWELAVDNELNGLTLGGVGNGTVIRNVEVFKSNDDGFEFFGGTVNASHLVSIDALDDALDFDNGYVGTIDTALVVVDPARADKSQSNGIESDNNAAGDSTATPITKPVLSHITLVGVSSAAAASITNGAPSGTGRYGRSAHIRRSSQTTLSKSIFIGFNNGIVFDQTPIISNSYNAYNNGQTVLTSVLSNAFVRPYAQEVSGVFTPLTTPSGNLGYTAAQSLNVRLVNPFVRPSEFGGAANYFPQASSPANSPVDAGAFVFGGTDWTGSWVRFQ
ncbi:hypothetical protein AAHN97_02445 [Chitinophaga niabensis]|uniref:hypothetical protein n=1 Tax=Chitinophaga niabensis TaxID=536979 RepID=UPI0031BB1490